MGDGRLDALRFIPWGFLDPFYAAVVQATEEAVVNVLVANDEMVGYRRAPHAGAAPRACSGDPTLARGDRIGEASAAQPANPNSVAVASATGVLTVSQGLTARPLQNPSMTIAELVFAIPATLSAGSSARETTTRERAASDPESGRGRADCGGGRRLARIDGVRRFARRLALAECAIRAALSEATAGAPSHAAGQLATNLTLILPEAPEPTT